MSVVGYFERPRRDSRMPKGPDSCGIRWEGPVLSGEMSVEERRRREEIGARSSLPESGKPDVKIDLCKW